MIVYNFCKYVSFLNLLPIHFFPLLDDNIYSKRTSISLLLKYLKKCLEKMQKVTSTILTKSKIFESALAKYV